MKDNIFDFTIKKHMIISIRKARKLLKKYHLQHNIKTSISINNIVTMYCRKTNVCHINNNTHVLDPVCLYACHATYIVAYYPEKIRKLIK